jgi:beta-phosphoglucomutase
MIEAVIFDFDGVIGDTMTDNCVAWQQSFAAYNCAIPAAEYYKLEGMGRYQIAEIFIKEHNLDPAITNDVVEAKESYYRNNNTFRIFDGVEDIFGYLKSKHIPMAIVTGASRARISEHLAEHLRIQLSALVTADDVTHTKPHPEPYLAAATQLNKAPGNCLVIENAILGIQSAKAAGCLCYAIETTLSNADLQIADKVFPTHQSLRQQLGLLFLKSE